MSDFKFPKKPLLLPMPKVTPPLKLPSNPIRVEQQLSPDESKMMQKLMHDWRGHIENRDPDAGFIHLVIRRDDGRVMPIKAWPLDYAIVETDENSDMMSVTTTFSFDPPRKPWYRRIINKIKSLWRLLF